MLAIIAAFLLASALLPSYDAYEFVLETDRPVGIMRQPNDEPTYRSIGKLDAAGNFVPGHDTLRVVITRSGNPTLGGGGGIINVVHRAGYEYRSGVLIQGRINNLNFVPEVGSKVIAFADYLKSFDPGVSPPIWNLPGTIRRKGGDGADAGKATVPARGGPPAPARGGALFPGADRPRAGDTLPGAVATPPVPAYRFVPDTDRRVEVWRRDGGVLFWSIGKLDRAGNFFPEKEYLNQTGPRPDSAAAAARLNDKPQEAVYEYRSGTLIRGRIDGWTFNVIPEVGSTVIDFGSYKPGPKESRYDPDPLPIWNLPGAFQKKEPGKK